jgi:UDP-glucose 4-epimerase
VQGSISLLGAMKKAGVTTLVFSSSATVYGMPEYLPYDEEHPTHPMNPYGQSKLQVEEILRDLSASDPNWKIASLRYFNPVGAHQSGLIGEDPNGIPNNLMPYVAKVAAGEISHLNIFGNDYETKDGTGERDYIHVMDLAEGHLAALKYIHKNSGMHVFNLGTGNPISVLDLVHAFEKVSSKKIPVKMSNRREGDLPVYYSKADAAKNMLQWIASRDLYDMCIDTWRWQESKNSHGSSC